jgi:hypothetical protein
MTRFEGSELLIEANVQSSVVCDVRSCSNVFENYRCFGVSSNVNLQVGIVQLIVIDV